MKLPSVSKKVLSIDFGSKVIKVIEGKYSNNNLNITKFFTVDLPIDVYNDGEILDKDTLVSIIKESFKHNKTSTETTYGIINSSSIITREISIPKVPENEVSSIIQYQLNDFLPVDPDEYVVNSMIMKSYIEDDVEKLSILLIGVPKTIVLSHLQLMKDLGLKPEILDYQGNSMAKLIGFNNQINGFYNTRDLAIASIDIGYSSTKLTIIKHGKIEVSRVINIGTKTILENLDSFFDYTFEEKEDKLLEIYDINITNDEFSDYNRMVNIVKLSIDNIIEKVETVFRYYISRESGNIINYIVLQGGLAKINGVDSIFSNYFNIPSIYIESLDKIKWNGDLITYSNAIGGLIRKKEVKK